MRMDAIRSSNRSRIVVRAKIDEAAVDMVIDTASDLTVISPKTWARIGSPTLKKTNEIAVCANGQEMRLGGRFKCQMEYGGVNAYGKVFVADVEQNLLGLDWFWKVKANRALISPPEKNRFSSASKPMKSSKAEMEKRPSRGGEKVCFRCGKAHLPQKCYYQNRACFICSGMGHCAVMCRRSKIREDRRQVQEKKDTLKRRPDLPGKKVRGKKNPETQKRRQVKENKTVKRIGSVLAGGSANMYTIDVNFGTEHCFPMRVDTGAEVTVVSEDIWKRLGEPSLSSVDCIICCPNGSELPCSGRFAHEIGHGTRTANGELYVTKSPINVLGQELFAGLGFKLSQVEHDV